MVCGQSAHFGLGEQGRMLGRVVTGPCLAVHALYHLHTVTNKVPFRAWNSLWKATQVTEGSSAEKTRIVVYDNKVTCWGLFTTCLHNASS